MRTYKKIKTVRLLVFTAAILIPMSVGLSALWFTTPKWREEGPAFAALIFTMVAVMVGILLFLLFGPKPKLEISDREIRFRSPRNSFTLDPATVVAVLEGYIRLKPGQIAVLSFTSRIRHGGDRWLLVPSRGVADGVKRKPRLGYSAHQTSVLKQIQTTTPNAKYHKIPLTQFSDAAEEDLVKTLETWGRPMLLQTR